MNPWKTTSLLASATLAGCGADATFPVAPLGPEPVSTAVVAIAPPPARTGEPRAALQLAVDPPPTGPFRCDGASRFRANGRSYCAYRTEATWAEAERRCFDNGGHLPAIRSEAENRALGAALASPFGFDGSVWIGLVEPREGQWSFVDLTPVSLGAWSAGEPNNAGDENCGEMYTASARWNDLRCDSGRAYLCEGRRPTPASRSRLRCTGEARPFEAAGIDYCLHSEASVVWAEAERACKADGGTLAMPRAQAEVDALQAKLGTPLGAGRMWIGFNDRLTEGRWIWASGDTTPFTRWRPGEPNNAGDEDCAEWFTSDAGWNDARCDERRAFLCEGPVE